MIDHVILPVSDVAGSIDFYTKTLAPLGLTDRIDYDGSLGPAGHPDLIGFGGGGRMTLWLRAGTPGAAHLGLVASSRQQVQDAYAAALAAGATEIHPPGPQRHYDPNYYAAQVRELDGYTLEFVYKCWQH